jgi:hypothetical protein
MPDLISWEEFNKYMKVGTIIVAHGFIMNKFVRGDHATIEYYPSFEDYQLANPKRNVDIKRYNEFFDSFDDVLTILMREQVRLMKILPVLNHVTFIKEFDGKKYSATMERNQIEKFYQIRFKDFINSNPKWIKFVDQKICNEKYRNKFKQTILEY